jgi:Type II secretion system (T2SS), protein G
MSERAQRWKAVIQATGRWWMAHPWIAWWLLVPVSFIVPRLSAASGVVDAAPILRVPVWLFSIVLFILGVVSFFRGAFVSFRKSPLRALATVGLPIVLSAAVMVQLRMNVESRARVFKAQDDVRALASAVSLYAQHMGRLPASLDETTHPSTNAKGVTAGGFIAVIPSPPAGYSPYHYEPRLNGTFRISSRANDDVTEIDTAQ